MRGPGAGAQFNSVHFPSCVEKGQILYRNTGKTSSYSDLLTRTKIPRENPQYLFSGGGFFLFCFFNRATNLFDISPSSFTRETMFRVVYRLRLRLIKEFNSNLSVTRHERYLKENKLSINSAPPPTPHSLFVWRRRVTRGARQLPLQRSPRVKTDIAKYIIHHDTRYASRYLGEPQQHVSKTLVKSGFFWGEVSNTPTIILTKFIIELNSES